MNSKLLGGILLVIGTTIGAGMLALPVATAQLGFWGSSLLLILCWGLMTTCAFLFLEVNLWLPANTNIISMAGATLGPLGQTLAWVTYLILLYSILSAYVAGGGDLFHYLFLSNGIKMPVSLASILFTTVFGLIVYLGMRSVDYVNRGLMFGKMGALLLLIVGIFPFITLDNLSETKHLYLLSPTSITVTAVSFGSLMIIPSLRNYFGSDIRSLKKAIFLGTFIPLLCYIAWNMVIMGVVPLAGLKTMLHSESANSELVKMLGQILQRDHILYLVKFFTSICMATSFLSISLSLSDFLSDGLSLRKKGYGSFIIYAATFLPPMVVVIFYPDAFIRGLSYAGLSVAILMVLMPPVMVWSGRYHKVQTHSEYRVPGGKLLLMLLILFALIMISFGIEGLLQDKGLS